MSPAPFDVAVIGAGPAGSCAARLLASWGHRVALLHRPNSKPANIAESLPPSIRTALHLAGIQEAVDAAGFARSAGNTVWWGLGEPRTEEYPPLRWGYHVERASFDRLLRGLAVQSGAEPREGDPPPARYTLDCSGRAGVFARCGLRILSGLHTIGLSGVWRKPGGFSHPGHTLIETYRDGWAWSLPLDEERRYVSVMADAEDTARTQGQGVDAMYRAELRKTTAFLNLLEGAGMEGAPSGCDASPYHASAYADSRVLLVGDAASFIDPLSSFGVKKALTSAWLAAVAVHTSIIDSTRESLALAYFEERERQAFADASRITARHYREIAIAQPHPYWKKRASVPAESEFYEASQLMTHLERLRQAPSLHLRCASNVTSVMRPAISGNEIVTREMRVAPQLPPGLEYISGVEVSRLMEMAPRFRQAPDLYEAYIAENEPVDLPNFLGALCVLLAKGVLVSSVA